MEANKFRLGNYVTTLTGGKVKLPTMITEKIGMISFFAVHLYDYKKPFAMQESFRKESTINLCPIPLTEERMLEFGAVEIEVAGMDNEFKIMANEFYISWDKTYGVIIFTLDGEHSFSIEHIKYVHQLQNFYFGRTGQELTIKQ